MTTEEINEKFIDFLCTKSILFRFLEIIKETKFKTIETYYTGRLPEEYFIGFFWQSTNEGYDYWCKINADWFHILIENKIININEK